MYERGIVELADVKYRVLNILPFSSLISVSTLALYVAFRLKCLLSAYYAGKNPSDVVNSGLYFVAELGLLCQSSVSRSS